MERVATYLSHQNFCDGPLNLALGSVATASSVQPHTSHAPSEAIDGLQTRESCYWSDSGRSHWWSLDLGREVSIRKIKITNTVSVVKGGISKKLDVCTPESRLLLCFEETCAGMPVLIVSSIELFILRWNVGLWCASL